MGERSRSSGLMRPEFGGSLDWLVVAFGVALAAIHLYLWTVDGQSPFLVIGVGFLVGVAVFPSQFWRPVVYLVAVGYSFVLGVVWLLSGLEHLALGVATGVINTAFVVLALYRFVRETSRSTRD